MSNLPKHLHKTCERHREMILDPWRTPLLKQAIGTVVKPGNRVLDLGCGIGLLSFFAAMAGAHAIDAIDSDREAIDVARYFAAELSTNIHFWEGLSYDQTLPHKVDVLVCEIIGSLAFEENILSTLLDARARFLKRGGTIIPERIELWGALVKKRAGKHRDWQAIALSPAALLSEPKRLVAVDTERFSSPEWHAKPTWKATRAGTLGGLALWPKIVWWQDLVTDASPLSPLTHWKQGYLPLPAQKIRAGDRVRAELMIHPHPLAPKERSEILWRII